MPLLIIGSNLFLLPWDVHRWRAPTRKAAHDATIRGYYFYLSKANK